MSAHAGALRGAPESARAAALGNGLAVVTDRVDSVESVTVGILVAAGARHESGAENGVSHFLEHMAFKGTRTRSAFEIAAEIEDVGGHLNAYTSRETTVYHATVLRRHLPLAVEILADILQNPVFDEGEIERERGVILQEIGEAADTPDDVVFDRFQETAYPGQPLGRPVLGTAATVSGISRGALTAHVGAHYGANRMVLSAAGALDHDETAALAEAALGGAGPAPPGRPAPAAYAGGDWRRERGLEQAHLVVGFEGVAAGDGDHHALAVLSTALGGGMSSRLFQELRERRGLAYSVYTFSSSYRDGGLFGVYAGTGAGGTAELVAALCGELSRAASEPLGEAELARARTLIAAEVLLSRESMAARASRMAAQMHLFGRLVPVAETMERLDAVTAGDVRRTAERVLSSTPTVAALGPVGGLEGHAEIAARLG